MRKPEVPVVLAALSQFQYVQADEVAVEMWHASLDEDMPAAFAAQVIARMYAEDPDRKSLLPGHINREWRGYKNRQATLGPPESAEARDRRCHVAECACTHSEPCYRGWLDDQGDGMAVPCRSCRPGLADVLATMPPPGSRTQADFARLTARGKGDYAKSG